MDIYFEPQNVNQWNMFGEKVQVGRIEPFFAVKSMNIGDLVLLYIGKQNKDYKPGVYAIGEVIDEPAIYLDNSDCWCYGRLCVNLRITKISYNNPLISYERIKTINNQYRVVHKLDISEKELKQIVFENED